jgi:predicted transcriptional regulator
VESFEFQRDRLLILEGIARGERAIEEGRVLSEDQAKARMGRWLS